MPRSILTLKQHLSSIQAETPLTDERQFTAYALGGFWDEDDAEQSWEDSQASPTYVHYSAPPKVAAMTLKRAPAENELRMLLCHQMDLFIEAMYETRGNVSKACLASGMNRSMAAHIRGRVAVFDQMWAEVEQKVTDDLEEAGLTRAIDGVTKGVYFQGSKCGEEQVFSDGILTTMLQGRRAEVYAQRLKSEVKNSGSVTIEGADGALTPEMLARLDDDEVDQLFYLLRKASGEAPDAFSEDDPAEDSGAPS